MEYLKGPISAQSILILTILGKVNTYSEKLFQNEKPKCFILKMSLWDTAVWSLLPQVFFLKYEPA